MQKFKLYILERLKNGDKMDDIIPEICKEMNISWNEAREFAEDLYAENKDDITLYQSPVLVMIALVVFLSGAGLIAYTAYNLYEAYQAGRTVPDGFALYFTVNLENILAKLLFGTGMLIGSLKGMQDVWESIFRKTGMI
jgi:hypothetical protein